VKSGSIEEAIRLLKRDSQFLYKLGETIGELGVVGEENNRLIVPRGKAARQVQFGRFSQFFA
jgi:hypothetical protein